MCQPNHFYVQMDPASISFNEVIYILTQLKAALDTPTPLTPKEIIETPVNQLLLFADNDDYQSDLELVQILKNQLFNTDQQRICLAELNVFLSSNPDILKWV